MRDVDIRMLKNAEKDIMVNFNGRLYIKKRSGKPQRLKLSLFEEQHNQHLRFGEPERTYTHLKECDKHKICVDDEERDPIVCKHSQRAPAPR